MAPIKINKVVSVSSEDRGNSASNLLVSDSFKKWCVEKPGLTKATVILQLESEQRITGVDIGNNGSAFVEILVGKSSSDNVMENLINSTALMSPSESRSQSNFYKIKMFSKQDLCKVSLDGKWDKVKVVCSQPYNKIIKFGLSMITFHGEPSTPKRPPTQPTIHLPKKISNSSPKTPQRSTGTPSSNGERKAASKLLAGVTLNKEDVSQQALNDLKEKGGTKTASSIVSKVIDVSELPKPSRTSSQNKSSSSSSHSDNKPSSSGADRFETLLSGVVIVISGYQNPLRSDIRQLALSMGASYRPDWNSQATHLICAVPNTPKYNHVKGRGIIVKKEWIFACRDKRQRVSETKYRMDLDKSDSESEDNSDNERESIDEDRDDAEVSITAKGKRKKKGNIKYQDSSSESEDAIPSKKMKRDNEDSYHPSDDEMEDEEDAEFYENVPSDEGDSSSHGDNDNSETSENDNASSKKKKIRKPSKKDAIKLPDISDSEDEKEGDIYEAETDAETEDDIIERLQLPPLPNFFAGHNFFLHRDAMDNKTIKSISRLLIAYGGKIYEHMNSDVRFVITPSSVWKAAFDDAVEVRPDVRFLNQQWVYRSAETQEPAPKDSYYLHQT